MGNNQGRRPRRLSNESHNIHSPLSNTESGPNKGTDTFEDPRLVKLPSTNHRHTAMTYHNGDRYVGHVLATGGHHQEGLSALSELGQMRDGYGVYICKNKEARGSYEY